VVFVVREIQVTPNPNAMKYVLDRTIASQPASFFSQQQAKDHSLASRLFAIGGVTNVMILGDFVTIGKEPKARWSDINGRVKQILAAE
jgi:hypothetical protein